MSLLEMMKPAYIAYAQTNTHKKKVKKSEDLIKQVLSKHKRPYVAYSTGKDSTCLLDMVYRINPHVEVMFHDSTVELPESYEQLKKVEENWGLKVHIVKNPYNVFELYKEYDIYNNDAAERKIQKLTLNNPIKEYVIENGFDLVFLGLRKQESKRRLRMLCKYGNYFYCKSNAIYECMPLSEWKKEDVWAYIFTHWPLENLIHPAYYKDRLVKDPGDIRVSWWCETNCITTGQLLWIKMYYPDLFNKLAREFPEVKGYV